MIADMVNNGKLELLITELFIKSRKIYASIVLIRNHTLQFKKKVGLNFTHYFIMKICNKYELQ